MLVMYSNSRMKISFGPRLGVLKMRYPIFFVKLDSSVTSKEFKKLKYYVPYTRNHWENFLRLL